MPRLYPQVIQSLILHSACDGEVAGYRASRHITLLCSYISIHRIRKIKKVEMFTTSQDSIKNVAYLKDNDQM